MNAIGMLIGRIKIYAGIFIANRINSNPKIIFKPSR